MIFTELRDFLTILTIVPIAIQPPMNGDSVH